MDRAATDLLLERMFRARRLVLQAGAASVFLLTVLWLKESKPFLPQDVEAVFTVMFQAALLVALGGSLFTCYYLFLVSLREAGPKYALGHVLVCLALTPVALLGAILLPLLVHNDIERWRQREEEPPVS